MLPTAWSVNSEESHTHLRASSASVREAQAVADHFGVKIFVMTSYAESELIEICPRGPLKSKRVLYLSFWAEVRCRLFLK